MTTYVALLRGVNVGAHNRMKMDGLRAVCESLGYGDVRTYNQSGTVVFEASGTDEATLLADLHDATEAEFGYDVTGMVRTREELDAVVADAPFEEPAGDGRFTDLGRRLGTDATRRNWDVQWAVLEPAAR